MNKFTTYLKSRLFIASAGILLTTAQTVSAQQLPEKKFSHPERVKYDNQCFTIEGEDIFVFSAAFHYFRCPEELWRDRFAKIKEAGFNTVETYVPWNWHERNMPKNV
ncbi:MAG TPA: beta-galactosidase, partial [Porphyromonadaceae bacterium]|nr:beta-galactosidase [Porphyromonadaceae bacterium]